MISSPILMHYEREIHKCFALCPGQYCMLVSWKKKKKERHLFTKKVWFPGWILSGAREWLKTGKQKRRPVCTQSLLPVFCLALHIFNTLFLDACMVWGKPVLSVRSFCTFLYTLLCEKHVCMQGHWKSYSYPRIQVNIIHFFCYLIFCCLVLPGTVSMQT